MEMHIVGARPSAAPTVARRISCQVIEYGLTEPALHRCFSLNSQISNFTIRVRWGALPQSKDVEVSLQDSDVFHVLYRSARLTLTVQSLAVSLPEKILASQKPPPHTHTHCPRRGRIAACQGVMLSWSVGGWGGLCDPPLGFQAGRRKWNLRRMPRTSLFIFQIDQSSRSSF